MHKCALSHTIQCVFTCPFTTNNVYLRMLIQLAVAYDPCTSTWGLNCSCWQHWPPVPPRSSVVIISQCCIYQCGTYCTWGLNSWQQHHLHHHKTSHDALLLLYHDIVSMCDLLIRIYNMLPLSWNYNSLKKTVIETQAPFVTHAIHCLSKDSSATHDI